jgi:hypothetical protein
VALVGRGLADEADDEVPAAPAADMPPAPEVRGQAHDEEAHR